jgi:hypothetical protein
MNLEKALVAKLKGAKIDCRDCKYWAQAVAKHGIRAPNVLVNYCAEHVKLKTDHILCSSFDGGVDDRREWKFRKGHATTLFHRTDLSEEKIRRLCEYHRSSSR